MLINVDQLYFTHQYLSNHTPQSLNLQALHSLELILTFRLLIYLT